MQTSRGTKQVVSKFLAFYLAFVLVASPGLAAAQVQGVSVNPDFLGDAFQGTVDDTFEDIETGINDGIDDGVGELGGTGNPILDGAVEGVSSVAAGALSCMASAGLASILPAGAAIAGLSVPTSDAVTGFNTGGNFSKECLLDQIGFQLKEGLIKGILRGMVTYINNGFSGGPGYLQDEEQYFTNLRDEEFDSFINDPSNFSSLCSAWESDVRLALATQYTTSVSGGRVTQISGTGTGTGSPIDTGDSASCELQSEGYASTAEDGNFWGRFETQTTTTGGNPVTSYFSLKEQFQENLQYNVEKKMRELERNDGFFNVTYCDDGSAGYSEMPGESVSTGEQNCKVTTPGTVINHQLNSALDSDLRRLELADEFDEVFSALIGQLINMVFSEMGLFGTTQRSGGSQSLIDEYAGSVNEGINVASREELLRQLDNYQESTEEHIEFKQRGMTALFDARAAIYDAMACYDSKYNTWVRTSAIGTSNYVIPPEEVEDVPLDERERATFVSTIVIGPGGRDGEETTRIFLEPDETQAQLEAYSELLDEVNGYILAIQDEIDIAELQIDEARILKIQLGAIDDSEDPISAALASSTILARIAEEFEGAENTVTVELDDGTRVEIPQDLSAQQILEIYTVALEELRIYDNQAAMQQAEMLEAATVDMLQGVELEAGGRAPGVLEDIDKCRSFTRVYNPNPDPGDGGR